MPTPVASKNRRWFQPIVEFFVHTIVGTVVFLVIFSPAIGINIELHVLEERYKIDHWLVWGATAGEIMLAAADIILYGVFLGVAAWQAAKELLHG